MVSSAVSIQKQLLQYVTAHECLYEILNNVYLVVYTSHSLAEGLDKVYYLFLIEFQKVYWLFLKFFETKILRFRC